MNSRGFLLIIVCALFMATMPSTLEARPSASPVAIPNNVSATLQTSEQVRVIVELTDAPMLPDERQDRSALRARIARAQQPVLDGMRAPNARLVRRFEGLPAFVMEGDAAAISYLSTNPRVKSITLDQPGEGALGQSVPLINADDTRDGYGLTGEGVIVAVLDSGIDTDHPDLAGDVAYERCFLLTGCPGGGTTGSGPGSAEDDHGHGSHVSGTITSTGVLAAEGVAPDAQIAAYKVLNSSNVGFLSDWDAALSDIIANHPEVDVVNMSLVNNNNHIGSCDASFPVTTSAINTLRSNGVGTFVSSGNNGFTTGITYPACITNAIAVGAVWDATGTVPIPIFTCSEVPVADKVTCWSNSASTIDILAPGAVIVAPVVGGVGGFAGTSMAAPHAAGVAAQLLDAFPSLTVNQIETAMENGGVPRTDAKNGIIKPRIDALGALLQLDDPDGDLLPSSGDNCPTDANPLQENTDRNFVDTSPPYVPATDDKTWPMSDVDGDACDSDDDNDGISDANEATGASCAGIVTNALLFDTDGDQVRDGAECALGTNPTNAGSEPALTACGPVGDSDGDKISTRVEFCYYGSNTALVDSDGDASGGLDGDGGKDGCEIASINADQIVSSGDQGKLASGISGSSPYHVGVDINKDGLLNSGDQGLMASFIAPPGQCP